MSTIVEIKEHEEKGGEDISDGFISIFKYGEKVIVLKKKISHS